MSIFCKALDKSFKDKKDLFKELKANKEQIIDAKKAEIIKSFEKGVAVTARPLDSSKFGDSIKEVSNDDNYYYIAVNSTRILDSHDDLHIDGIWKRTVKNQQGKNYLVDTHVLGINTTIARKEYIEIFTAIVPFSMIGKSYDGDTEVLIYKVRKDKIISPIAKEWLDSGDSIEASVRMQYVDIELALNSDAKEDKDEKKVYDKYIDIIANKEDFENEIYYFWAVKEAKNVMESSLVLFGSNNATGQIENSTKDGSTKVTQNDNDSAEATRKEEQEKELRTFYLNS